eukprot:gnl/MRDRNA2_/MRDRNA2_67937_c0_seq2.p1 gnl/MRDRNA2_/MRDRNA2_67937_c0~~gnl/MRDRNA2_/MRDRNA2_67937_c0_seq2.p1  ORF type:complete len:428 (+),score=82.00 gnl/MRDRNA2_/MRDRNA2_67937_c0_seq2:106-1389(+)
MGQEDEAIGYVDEKFNWKKTILNRYTVDGKEFLGQGSFSIVRKGVDTKTGDAVAIKMYKVEKNASSADLQEIDVKFKHQVVVLTELQKQPTFEEQVSCKSWNVSKVQELESVLKLDQTKYFCQLLDYSKDSKGQPGKADDGCYYIVLELALYTLDDYLDDRRRHNRPMRMPDVQRVFRSLVNMVACLHAHGYVHLDIKPENIMRMSSGDWKLIDVDGAVRHNSDISVEDNTISFTPLYCAPEFARVLSQDLDYVHVSRLMDVWSIGMTALDLVLSQPALEQKYSEIVERTGECNEYFDWLSDTAIELGLPQQLEKLDKDFFHVLQENMLVKDPRCRASIPEVMQHPFYTKTYTSKKKTESSGDGDNLSKAPAPLRSDEGAPSAKDYGMNANRSRRMDALTNMQKKDPDSKDKATKSVNVKGKSVKPV